MSILVDKNTRLLLQGAGRAGRLHAKNSAAYCCTNLVGAVHPGKGGTTILDDVPVFDTVAEAVSATGAQASAIYVPPPFAADAILEAVDAGIELVV